MRVTHRCPAGARPLSAFGPDRPGWAEPGQLVKQEGEDRWGRVYRLYSCCGVRLVHWGPDEAGEHHTYREMPLRALVNPYGAYPALLPPQGYPVPDRQGRLYPFGGPTTEVRA
jgi:hypothetical protein